MWMFGSRTTVKKVRNSLTWFSHHSQVVEGMKTEVRHGLAGPRYLLEKNI